MSLSANAGRSLFLRDAGNIRMDMDGVERLDLTALGGPDAVTVQDMSGTDFRRADVETDGAKVDVEGLKTEVRIAGSDTIDRLQVNSLGGNDEVDVEQAVFSLIGVEVDLGSGQL
jgi:hypothetical protein